MGKVKKRREQLFKMSVQLWKQLFKFFAQQMKRLFDFFVQQGRRLFNLFVQHIYLISYLFVVCVLWKYLYQNWEECISMKFFSEFDGNNILFVVGVLLVILPFYDIEGKGFKIRSKLERAMDKEVQDAHTQYMQAQIKNRSIPQSQDFKNQSEVAVNDK